MNVIIQLLLKCIQIDAILKKKKEKMCWHYMEEVRMLIVYGSYLGVVGIC